jgi:hypothetical protein
MVLVVIPNCPHHASLIANRSSLADSTCCEGNQSQAMATGRGKPLFLFRRSSSRGPGSYQ